MNTLLLIAVLGQFGYAGDVASPPVVRESSAVAEPFPERPIPRVFRVVRQREVPAGPETYHVALADEKPAPKPPGAVYVVPDADQRIAELEAEVAALRKRIDVLERRPTTPDRVAVAPRTTPPAVVGGVCPQGCPFCDRVCDYAGQCGHPQCGRRGPAPAPKQWFNLTNEPGTQGYGAQNAAGEVIVEKRRPLAPAVTYATQPVTYAPPVTYATAPPVFYGSPYGAAGSVCGPGGCGGAARGFFGRLLGR